MLQFWAMAHHHLLITILWFLKRIQYIINCILFTFVKHLTAKLIGLIKCWHAGLDRDIFLELNVQSLKLDSGLLFTYVAEDVFIVSAFQEGKSLKPIYIEIFLQLASKHKDLMNLWIQGEKKFFVKELQYLWIYLRN